MASFRLDLTHKELRAVRSALDYALISEEWTDVADVKAARRALEKVDRLMSIYNDTFTLTMRQIFKEK